MPTAGWPRDCGRAVLDRQAANGRGRLTTDTRSTSLVLVTRIRQTLDRSASLEVSLSLFFGFSPKKSGLTERSLVHLVLKNNLESERTIRAVEQTGPRVYLAP